MVGKLGTPKLAQILAYLTLVCFIVMFLLCKRVRLTCVFNKLMMMMINSIKRRVESFIGSYVNVGYRFVTACSEMRCSVVFGVTLRLLVINISSSSPAINTAAR